MEQHPVAHTVKRLLITDEEKPIHFLSKCFIGVEQHPKLKRYRILSERLRTQSLDFYDKILGICAGLWNFYLASISL